MALCISPPSLVATLLVDPEMCMCTCVHVCMYIILWSLRVHCIAGTVDA